MRVLLIALLLSWSVSAHAETDYEAMAFDLFKFLVESDTTHSTGDTLAVVTELARRLKAAGLPEDDVRIVTYGENPEGVPKGNLVARLRSQNPTLKPVLLLAHLDVVEANPDDWSMDPTVLNEIDEFYYGRGTLDDKDEIAIHMTNLIRLHNEQVPLKRDVIVAFTADEEGGEHNGARHLVQNHRDLVDAAFVINEGGGGSIRDGRHITNTVQTAEKVYQSYTLEITNSGGHSSLPRSDNAIYQLAEALLRIQAHEFPVMVNETTRAYFGGLAQLEAGETGERYEGLLASPPDPASVAFFSDVPAVNARLRTTCVATKLDAGHAENALPQRARATVNCRVFPGVPVEEVRQALLQVADTEGLTVTPIDVALASDASPLTPEVMDPVREITEKMWPGAKVLPIMSTGATDGLFFRNSGIPVYGVSGIFNLYGDNRAHGRDERILKRSFYEGLDFLYQLTRAVAVDDDVAGPSTRL